MRKISKNTSKILLFIVTTYGERIFNSVYTVLSRTPREMFIALCVSISFILITVSTPKE